MLAPAAQAGLAGEGLRHLRHGLGRTRVLHPAVDGEQAIADHHAQRHQHAGDRVVGFQLTQLGCGGAKGQPAIALDGRGQQHAVVQAHPGLVLGDLLAPHRVDGHPQAERHPDGQAPQAHIEGELVVDVGNRCAHQIDHRRDHGRLRCDKVEAAKRPVPQREAPAERRPELQCAKQHADPAQHVVHRQHDAVGLGHGGVVDQGFAQAVLAIGIGGRADLAEQGQQDAGVPGDLARVAQVLAGFGRALHGQALGGDFRIACAAVVDDAGVNGGQAVQQHGQGQRHGQGAQQPGAPRRGGRQRDGGGQAHDAGRGASGWAHARQTACALRANAMPDSPMCEPGMAARINRRASS